MSDLKMSETPCENDDENEDYGDLQENDSEVFKAQLAQSKLVKLPSGLSRVLRTFTKLQRYIGHTFKPSGNSATA